MKVEPSAMRSRARALCAGVGALLLCLAMVQPAAAQEAGSVPACGDNPSPLRWQVRKDGKRRSVNIAFAGGSRATPLKPVQVSIARSGKPRKAFQWNRLNISHYDYRRRGREVADLTAVFVENRSAYGRPGTGGGGLGIPGLPNLPTLPALPSIPGLPGLPALPLPLLGDGGTAGAFEGNYCRRTLTARAR